MGDGVNMVVERPLALPRYFSVMNLVWRRFVNEDDPSNDSLDDVPYVIPARVSRTSGLAKNLFTRGLELVIFILWTEIFPEI